VTESAEPARLVNARRFLMGITTDNSSDVLSLLSPDVVYTVPGQAPLAGVFRDRSECATTSAICSASPQGRSRP
jgi:ketosteroid isomerase-like protein